MPDLIQNAETAAEIIMNFKNYCTYGNTLIIPEGVEEIGMAVFRRTTAGGYGDTYLQNLVLPPTLKEIHYEAFAYNPKLTSVIIPHGCEKIYVRAFVYCEHIQYLYLPNTIETCYHNSFTPTSDFTTLEVEQGFNGCIDFSLSNANLSAEVMVRVLTNLKDRTGEYAYTLQFGTTNLSKLTSEQIAIATNKNWNLA